LGKEKMFTAFRVFSHFLVIVGIKTALISLPYEEKTGVQAAPKKLSTEEESPGSRPRVVEVAAPARVLLPK
jgi:hypothetical protein